MAKAKTAKAKAKTRSKLGGVGEIEQGFVCRDHAKFYVCGGAVMTEAFWKLTPAEREAHGLVEVERREGRKAPGTVTSHDLGGVDDFDFEKEAHTVLVFKNAKACETFTGAEFSYPKPEGRYLCDYPANTIWEDLTEQGTGAMAGGRKG